MIHRVASIAVLLGCLSCGGSQPPAAAATTSTEERPAAEAAPDLSPVAAPPELVLVGRVARPRAFIETLASWGGLPLRLTDVLPAEVRELESVIAWDAPIEIASVLDRRSTEKVPPPVFVASIGLTSIDGALSAARSRGATPTPVAPGIFRVNVDDDASCAIAASAGPVPVRLVCGDEWEDVEELLPYATRGLPIRDLGQDDIFVELTTEPIRRRYAQELTALRAMAGLFLRMASLDNKRFDRVLTDIAYSVADELKSLANEIDRVQVTGKIDAASKSLDLMERIVLRRTDSERSFASEALEQAGRRATPPPDDFWKLPATASTGVYTVSLEHRRLASFMKSVGELADAYLEHEKIGPTLRNRARRLIEAYPTLLVGSTAATGADEGEGKGDHSLNYSWSVGVMNQRADVLTGVFADLSALLADRELAKVMRTRLDLDPKLLPKTRTQVVKVNGFDVRGTAMTLELSTALLNKLEELDKKSSTAEPDKAKPNKPLTLTTVVVPDGQRSFIAYAPTQKRAVQLLESMRAGTEKNLSAVPELASLRSVKAVWAGYWTLEAFIHYLDGERRRKGMELLTRAPNHGRTPWFMRMEVAEQPKTLTLSVSARIPQGAFQDGGSLVPHIADSL